MTKTKKRATREPSLAELLDDPVAEAVMRRDRVAADDVVALFDDLRRRLAARKREAA